MKNFAIISALCVQCHGSYAAPTPATTEADATQVPQELRGKMDVWLLIGQSNMVGQGVLQDSSSKPHPRVWMLGNDYQWKAATEPIDSAQNQIDAISLDPNAAVGPAMSFALALVQKDAAVQIALVPCAKGGRPLKYFLRPAGEEIPNRDSLYGSALHRARQARKMGRLAGVLFFQGEGDANDATKRPETFGGQWDTHFAQWVSDFRRDLESPTLPIIFAQIGTTISRNYPRWEEVKAAQARVKLPNVAMIQTEDLPRKDAVHFTTPAYEEIGRRFANAALKLAAPTESTAEDAR